MEVNPMQYTVFWLESPLSDIGNMCIDFAAWGHPEVVVQIIAAKQRFDRMMATDPDQQNVRPDPNDPEILTIFINPLLISFRIHQQESRVEAVQADFEPGRMYLPSLN
jgi:hypothetical protein